MSSRGKHLISKHARGNAQSLPVQHSGPELSISTMWLDRDLAFMVSRMKRTNPDNFGENLSFDAELKTVENFLCRFLKSRFKSSDLFDEW